MKIYQIKSFYKDIDDYYNISAAIVVVTFKITRGVYNDSFKKEKI